jgi:hypothetical protein
MSRPVSSTTDLTAYAFIEAGINNVTERFKRPQELLVRALGVSVLTDILPGVRERIGTTTTGSFYRRWEGVDAFNQQLVNELVTRAFGKNPRGELLLDQLHVRVTSSDRNLPMPEQLASMREGYAASLAKKDHLLAVRYFLRPLQIHLNVDEHPLIEDTTAYLQILNQFADGESKSDEAWVSEAQNFLQIADSQAIIIQASSSE